MSWVFLFFAVTFLRGFLEGVLERSQVIGFRLETAQSVEMMFLHGPLFYLLVLSLATLVLSVLARSPADRTARAALAFSPVILVAPLVDAVLSPHGFRLHYFSDLAAAGRGLILTFNPAVSLKGVSPGMRVEVLLACLGGALYLRAKRGGVLLPAVAFVAVYLIPVFAGSLPALFTLVARGNVPEHTLFTQGGLVFSETRKYALVLLPVAAVATALCYARYRAGHGHGSLRSLARASRPLRSLFYGSIAGFGLVLGASFLKPYYPEFLSDSFARLGALAAVLSIYFLFQFQVILNDYFDREIDRLSSKRTYFTLEGFGSTEAAILAVVSLALSLAFAAAVGYASLTILLAAHIVGIVYSVPPMRFKRLFLVNTFVLALGVLLVAYLGFSLFGGRHSIAAFPHGVAGAMVVGFTMALGIKDVSDYADDCRGGVRTIVTVLGFSWGRRLLAAAMLAMYVAVPFLVRYPLLAVVCVPCGVASALGVLRWGERTVFIAFFVFAAAIGVLTWNGSVFQRDGGAGSEGPADPRDAIGRGLGTYLEGINLAQGSKHAEAAQLFHRLAAENTPALGHLLPDALTRMGVAELRLGKASKAYGDLDRAAAAPPFPEDAAVHAAAAGLEAGYRTQSLQLLDEAIDRRPQSARLHLARAAILVDSYPAAATADLEFAYRCSYDLAVTCAYLGDVTRAAGNTPRAEQLYRKALTVDPCSIAALVGLADILRARGDLEAAAEMMMEIASILGASGKTKEAAYWARSADETRRGE